MGTRFLPVTRAVPKPLLPVITKPLVQYAVDEAILARVGEVSIVVSPGHEVIQSYFMQGSRPDSIERDDAAKTRFRFVEQATPSGLGHAVGVGARNSISDPVAVLLPDDVF